jgi:transposase InsO family protein
MSKNRKRRAGPNASLPRGGFAKVSYQSFEKAGGMIVARSALEADVLLHLEMDHLVAGFERNDLSDLERVQFTLGRQPAPTRIFELTDGGAYTPDLRVHLADGRTVYIEVGPYRHKTHPQEAARLEQAMTTAREEGTQLVVITEREVRRGHRLDNLMRLAPHLRTISTGSSELVGLAHARLQEQAILISELTAWLHTHVDEAVPLDTCEEAARSALAHGARSGQLTHDLDGSLIDEGTQLHVGREVVAVSWLQRLLVGGTPLASDVPEATAIPEDVSVVLPIETDRDSASDAQLLDRLRIVRDKESHAHLSWQELAQRHHTTVDIARYTWRRYKGTLRSSGNRLGEAAVLPGRVPDGLRAPPDFKEALKRAYASPRAPTVINVWRSAHLKALARKLGIKVSYWQVRRHVKNVLERDPDVIAKRAGRPVLPARAFAGDADWVHRITVPGQVVQVDFARLDAFVNNDARTGSFRPYLLCAIDVATRCVLAWVICATEPNEAEYRKLLHMLFSPKDVLLRNAGINPTSAEGTAVFPCHGLPAVILADRGWIFTAHDSRRLLTEMLGIRVEHAAEFQPTMKAIIERLFGTINDRFLHRIPGSAKP